MLEISLFDLVTRVLKKWYLILISVIVWCAIGFGISKIIPDVYQSSSLVYIRGNSSISTTLADLQIGSYLSKDYEVIFKSRPVLEKTIKQLNLDLSTKELSDLITIKTVQDTRILTITCKTHNAILSKEIVNTIVKEAIDKINEIDAKEPYIIEKAITSNETVSLSPIKVMALTSVIGLMTSVVYIIITSTLNSKIEDISDLEKLGLPVLGTVFEDDSFNSETEDLTLKKSKKDKKKNKKILDEDGGENEQQGL